ncbi:MAG: hypothetical protein LUM44_17690 [Pyrinomonadaceae bacterium]|nr:hypothetical protein [Pyrinomonadaceae bacterium]
MATFQQNVKKILCCNGMKDQKAVLPETIKNEITAQFVTACSNFIVEAGTIVNETIPVPLPPNPTNIQQCIIYGGAVQDAMGRLLGMGQTLPAQSTIDAFTASAEAVMNSI